MVEVWVCGGVRGVPTSTATINEFFFFFLRLCLWEKRGISVMGRGSLALLEQSAGQRRQGQRPRPQCAAPRDNHQKLRETWTKCGFQSLETQEFLGYESNKRRRRLEKKPWLQKPAGAQTVPLSERKNQIIMEKGRRANLPVVVSATSKSLSIK